jgi:hypothetical protein
MMDALAKVLGKEKNAAYVKKQADMLADFRESLPAFLSTFGAPTINGSLSSIANAKKAAGDNELSNYILSKLPADAMPKKEIKISVNDLQKYTGEYDLSGMVIKVYIENETLTALVPGQPAYPLAAIDTDKFTFKTLKGFKAVFNKNDKGEITEMIFIQPNGTYTGKKTK